MRLSWRRVCEDGQINRAAVELFICPKGRTCGVQAGRRGYKSQNGTAARDLPEMEVATPSCRPSSVVLWPRLSVPVAKFYFGSGGAVKKGRKFYERIV